MTDFRLESLKSWLEQHFNNSIDIELISGDASFRRYFRITRERDTFIAVDSRTDLVPITPFIELTGSYRRQRIPVPEVMASNEAAGFYLLSDLGDKPLACVLSEYKTKTYYRDALRLLAKIALVKGTDKHALPVFDEAFINTELNIFIQWFIERHLAITLNDSEHALINRVFNRLTKALLEQPQCTTHRDFHSRNIMVHNERLYLIDYQDSVSGPVTYDAVSLLRDCYVVCPPEYLSELQKQHFEQSLQLELIPEDVTFARYQRWFDLTGLQRHIKIAGIFCRLFYRDAKAGYLKDIPQALDYISQVTRRYPELTEFDNWMKSKIIPRYKRRSREQQ